MPSQKPRECNLWQGADRVAKIMAYMDEGVPGGATISEYLAGSKVVVSDDAAISDAFGPEFLAHLNAP